MRLYNFKEIKECDMCGSPSKDHTVMGMRMDKSQGANPKNIYGTAVGVLKCTKCHLIYSSPQPIPANIQDHYGTPPETY